MRTPSAGLILALCLVLCPGSSPAQSSEDGPATQSSAANTDRDQAAHEAKQAADLDLDQLANVDIKVTSASKKSEDLSAAPAAIYVLSGDEIRRGGFSSIPDALRMVPGLYVAQEDSHSWIISARGFSFAFNNKMLVLLDGRLLYQPLFGGVYWDTIEPPLADIDRIEVIRGPGGTLWGANAVNGVINIITKSSQATQGESISATYGVDDRYIASLRYGGSIGSNLSYRVFAQGIYGLPSVDASGALQSNNWNHQQGGIRMDWNISPRDKFSFEGGGYGGEIESTELNFPGPDAAGPVALQQDIQLKGGNILGRWNHEFSARSSTDVLAYCDWVDRFDILGGDIRHTCNLEVQHNLSITPRHSIIWGGSILTTIDTPADTFEVSYAPTKRRDNTYSVFGQYEVSLVPDRLRLIGGSKFEHNPYTGFEIQPQIRAVWTPDKTNTLWGAISRAVREPDRIDNDVDLKILEIPGGPLPVFFSITGNPVLSSEAVRAYELGYRYQPRRTLSLDLAAYYNDYSNLIGNGAAGSPLVFSNYIEIPLPFMNVGAGQTHGLELSAQLRPVRRWEISTGITELRGTAVITGAQGVVTPHHILNFQSRFDLTRHLNFDASYFYTDGLRELGLPTLNRVDVGISTRQFAGFTFSAWGRNLQSDHHLENNSGEPYFPAGEIRRSIVLKLVWQHDSERGNKP